MTAIYVPSSCSALSDVPLVVSSVDSFLALKNKLQTYKKCIGNPDDQFVSLCKERNGKFLSLKKEVVAFLDNTDAHVVTVRHSLCEQLVDESSSRCIVCQSYRANLRAMHSRGKKYHGTVNAKTNDRFLQTPQRKARMQSLRSQIKSSDAKIRRLKDQLSKATSVATDPQLESDLQLAISTNKEQIEGLPIHDFRRIFWEQQVSYIAIIIIVTLCVLGFCN